MSSFANFMKMVNPINHPQSKLHMLIEYLPNGKPNWATVPLGTPVKYYLTKKGIYSTRKTSIEIKATLIDKIRKEDPERPYEFKVKIKNFDEVQRMLYPIHQNDFYLDPHTTLYYDEIKLDLPND